MSSFPPSVPPNPPQLQPAGPNEKVLSNLSLIVLVACPTLALLPPRKLDLYTFALATGFVIAANHQTKLRTGQSILLNIYAWRHRNDEEMDSEEGRRKAWEQWEKDHRGMKGLAKKVWTGDAKPGWKEERRKEELENEEQGKGISDVIIEQVKEVWGVPKQKDEDDENDDDGEKGK